MTVHSLIHNIVIIEIILNTVAFSFFTVYNFTLKHVLCTEGKIIENMFFLE